MAFLEHSAELDTYVMTDKDLLVSGVLCDVETIA